MPESQSKRRDRLVVSRPDQVAAMTGPLPMRILAAMERLETATVGEIAGAIDAPAESLYYHIRRLARAGVIDRVGVRSTDGPDEAQWRLAAKEVSIDPASREAGFLDAIRKATRSILRLAERRYAAGLDAGAPRKGAARTLMIQVHDARLRRADIAELNRRLEDIASFIQERDDAGVDPAAWVSLTMVLSPAADH